MLIFKVSFFLLRTEMQKKKSKKKFFIHQIHVYHSILIYRTAQ